MNILVTGSSGFIAKNLIRSLKNIQQNKDKTRPSLAIDEIYEYDVSTPPTLLITYCQQADFVFHLAGVNRPQNTEEFMMGNFGFSSTLLNIMRSYHNTAPVMLASSVQASLAGRYADSEYGKSKLAGEELFLSYSLETGSRVLIYRFPNVFGKWCRPNYNSVIATFCHNMAHDLDITVNDPGTELELLYIDDLVNEMLDALEGREHHCEFDGVNAVPKKDGKYCYVPVTYRSSLREIVDLLNCFKKQPDTLLMPTIGPNSFARKLYSTYLSYLPESKIKFALKMNMDERGSFTEVLKTADKGQFSVNISKPGVTKGQHWHHSKWEFFIVVAGHGLIQERKIGTDENGNPYPVINIEVSGDKMEAVHMLPGYTHNIINLSETENLVTLMWANEQFDSGNPDTFFEKVE